MYTLVKTFTCIQMSLLLIQQQNASPQPDCFLCPKGRLPRICSNGLSLWLFPLILLVKYVAVFFSVHNVAFLNWWSFFKKCFSLFKKASQTIYSKGLQNTFKNAPCYVALFIMSVHSHYQSFLIQMFIYVMMTNCIFSLDLPLSVSPSNFPAVTVYSSLLKFWNLLIFFFLLNQWL